MKTLIRLSAFETNSSSCHSLTLNEIPLEVDVDIYPNEEGVLEVSLDGIRLEDEEDNIYSNSFSFKLAYVILVLHEHTSRSGIYNPTSVKGWDVLQEVVKMGSKCSRLEAHLEDPESVELWSASDSEIYNLIDNPILLYTFLYNNKSEVTYEYN